MPKQRKSSIIKPPKEMGKVEQPAAEETALLPSDSTSGGGQRRSASYGQAKSGYSGTAKSIHTVEYKHVIELGNGRKLNRLKKWGAFRFLVVKHFNFIQSVLWIMVMLAIFLAIVILFKAWDHRVQVVSTWDLDQKPTYYDFEEVSISSPSETCNEYLRMVVQEDHLPFAGLPLFMQACLSIAEPHASGPGGDTVLVYVKNGACRQVHGTEQFYHNMDGGDNNTLANWYLKRLKYNFREHFMGAATIRTPGDLASQMGMYELLDQEMMNDNFVAAVTSAFYVFRKELLDPEMHFPVSRRLHDVLTHIVAQATRENNVIKHLFGFNNEAPLEGFLYPLQIEELEKLFSIFFKLNIFANARKDIPEQFGENILEYSTSLLTDQRLMLQDDIDAKSGHLAKHRILENGIITKLSRDRSICSPWPVKFWNTNKVRMIESVVPAMLRTYGESLTADNRLLRFDALNMSTYERIIRQFVEKQADIRRLSNEIYGLTPKVSKQLAEFYASEKETLETNAMIRARQYMVGNGFVLVNHRRKEAFAVSSTLGDPFGSMLGRGMMLFNNLNADYGRNPDYGALKNLQEPIIVLTRDGEIEIAYSGPPGYTSYSMDIPRKMTSLVLTIFSNWNLETALTAPIVSYYRDTFVEIQGFSYKYVFNFLKSIGIIRTGEGNSTISRVLDIRREGNTPLTDEVAAVHGRRTMFHGMDKQRKPVVVMPSGF